MSSGLGGIEKTEELRIRNENENGLERERGVNDVKRKRRSHPWN